SPEAVRTGVFRNENPGNLVASETDVFIMVRDHCAQLDAATGQVKALLKVPTTKNEKEYEWGYDAYTDGILIGTATVRQEVEEKKRRRGKATEDATDAIFAIDVKTGEHLWSYEGKSIAHHTIALGPG